MGQLIDICGKRFGKWTVIAKADRQRWLCRCDCGRQALCDGGNLRGGKSRSCGCLKKDVPNHQTHGMCGSPEHKSWSGMIQRCTNPKDAAFDRYGGRGITVCERWLKFESFFADMGRRPSMRHSLDRYPNNDGDYEPTNCRWATNSQQARNRRSNRLVTAFGRTAPLVEFVPAGSRSERYIVVQSRLNNGWDAERALSVP